MDEVYRATLPIHWDLSQQLKAAKSAKEKKMRLDSIKFGAEKGISIPIHGPQEDFAILLVVQMHGEMCLNKPEAIQHTLFVAAYYFYSYLQPLLLKQKSSFEKFNLNPRELQCLTLVAKNYAVDAIAKNLQITARTVNYHIQRANKKMGVKNKYQAVWKAISNHLISL